MLATQDTIDRLNSFLHGELAATETYEQVLGWLSDDVAVIPLRKIRDDHRVAANTWRQHIHAFGGDPVQDSGTWGTFAKLVEGSSRMFGKTAALKALKEGEENGLHDYQAALQEEDLAMECQAVVRDLLPQGQEHIDTLDRLMKSASPGRQGS